MASIPVTETTSMSQSMRQETWGVTTQVANAGVRWSAIFAGFFVALLVYFGLVCLGLAISGNSIQENLQDWNALKNIGFGASLWTIVSSLIAICTGAYVSGRVAGLISTRVGRTQGAVIASM